MFSSLNIVVRHERKVNKKVFDSPVLDGADAYDLLCPVNALTGNRENPLRLLKILADSPEKSRALENVLVELPVMASQDGVSNDDMIQFMQREFCTGTPYENELWAERLESLSEGIFNSLGVNKDVQQISESKIDFNAADSPDVSE